MQFVLQYPDAYGTGADLLDAGPVGEVSISAERAGWAGVSFTEHPAPSERWLAAGGHQTLDPFVALGAAASVTSSIRLVTYLTVVAYRNPLLLAKAAATVDKLSNGRFVLGIGAGYLKGEFGALGVDFDERNELFDEALDVLPRHWAGDPFTYEGKHFTARAVIARPRPVQDPIPIWIGGNSMRTLRRVAARAQGWMPLLGPPELAVTTRTPHLDSMESLAARIALLRDLAGDRFESIAIAVPHHGQVDDATIDVEQTRDYFGRLSEIGVTWMMVAAPWGVYPATLDYIDRFAAAYLTRP